MKKSKLDLAFTIIFVVLALLLNSYIIYHSCLSGEESGAVSRGVTKILENIINGIRPGTITETNYEAFVLFVRKGLGHFGAFFFSGLLTSLAVYFCLKDWIWYKHYLTILISFIGGMILASVTEIIQLNVAGRSGELLDVLLDLSGYALGMIIILVPLFIFLKRSSLK